MTNAPIGEAPSAAAIWRDHEWWRLDSIIRHLLCAQDMLSTGCWAMYSQHREQAVEHLLDGDECLRVERERRRAKAQARVLEKDAKRAEGPTHVL